ncbi:MAG: M6 family metalloprotease domain-containing protein [Flavitalea sp.]
MERCQTSKIPFKSVRQAVSKFVFTDIDAASVTNITSITNRRIKGKPEYWLTKNGSDNVDHLAAVDLDNNLIVFWKTGSNPWKSVNVSAKAGHKVSSDITAWQTRNGPYNVEHLAARNPQGDLIVFLWSPQHDWQAVNVSEKTGRKIAGSPESWQTKSGQYNVEHLAARANDNSLLVFWWSPLHDWQFVNVSSKTGKKIKGNTISWQTKNGPFNVEHLAASGTDNSLLVFYWSSAHDWQVVNVSQKTNKKIAGNITAWQTKSGQYNVEHLGASGEDGNLLVFWWSPLKDWQAINVSSITGQSINGGPDNYHFREGGRTIEFLTSKNSENELILQWWRSDLDWQMINVSKITSVEIVGDPVAWTQTTSSGITEFIAAEGPNNSLRLFSLKGRERKMTDQIHRPVASFSRKRHIRHKVIAILWDPHKPGVTRPSKSRVDSLVFGSTESVKQYFMENSNGYFTISKAAVAGWYDATYPADEYWPPDPEDRPGRDSGRDAIIKASEDFNFLEYDKNDDDNLSTEELGILFLIPGSRSGGLNRVVGEDYTDRNSARGIRINDLLITWIAEVSIGYEFNPQNIGIIAHELSHLLLGHGDMYVDGFSSEAGPYGLMDEHFEAPHIDPVAKLKFGWLKPEIIFSSGTYELQNIEVSHKVYLLVHPQKGADEYFIIENRNNSANYDKGIPYNGILVWHVTELRELYDNSVPPRNVTQEEWDDIGGFSRKGIRAIRPRPVRTVERFKLWDGAFPERSYPLTSTNNDPDQSALVWADGTPSGFTIRNFSPAGEIMTFDVRIPF